ncbi:glycosyltransferase family 4 protein [Leeia aquatica]|uniref:Glycosyltransferase family 4 protein n=1 Tax=Leeia aquatica TaxID=2725557 RepID=A0A847SF25_9NEIS|nr:glycosyltransferase family 4 protein [Leeia aquatica]NLR75879.1 glycosyltransferase family 4 protein [Leeia aquatica]
MNILYINHYAGTPQLGMEYRPYYMAREWVRMGHQVTMVAASFAHTRSRQPDCAGKVTEQWLDGIRYLWLDTPRYQGNGVGRVLNIFRFVGRLFGLRRHLGSFKPDVVIASSTYPLDGYPARWLARKYGARLVFELHDLWPLSPMELGGMSARHPFIMLLQAGENHICRHADTVVSMLPRASDHLQQHGMPADRFHYVPNGIVVADWQEDLGDSLPEHMASLLPELRRQGRFVIGYAGAMGVANAMEVLLHAAAQVKDLPVSFVLIGHGPEKPALQRLAHALELAHVHFLDAIPKTQVPSALAWMDGLYIGWQRQPIYRFGINPNKLMDYMMAGKPVLHAVEAGNDAVQDAACGLSVPPEDPAALADGIRRMLALPESERDAMGARGREFVMQNHDYPVLARRFLRAMGHTDDEQREP